MGRAGAPLRLTDDPNVLLGPQLPRPAAISDLEGTVRQRKRIVIWFLLVLLLLLGTAVVQAQVSRASTGGSLLDAGRGVDLPAGPVERGQGSPALQMVGQVGGPTEAVAVQGDYAYVGVGLRLVVLDVSDPATPVEIGSTAPFPQFVKGVAVSGTVAYVAAGTAGLRIVDISTPAEPVEVGFYDTPGHAEGVAVAGQYAYVADGPYGLRIVDIASPLMPVEVAYAYPLNYVFDVDVEGGYAYLAAAGAGLLVVDVSDPADPSEVGSSDTPGYAYGLDVSEDMVCVADGWEGLRVMSRTDPAYPVEEGFYNTAGWSFGVYLSDTIAYVADGFAGLTVLDVSDAANPAELGRYEVTGGHAGRVVVADAVAYVADRNWGLRVVDVSDSGAPAQVGSYAPLGEAVAVAVSGDYAYVAAATYGLRVVDISDPAHPVEVGAYDAEGNAIGVAVVGNYAYLAVWCSSVGAGLHVVDVSDPVHPTRVAHREGVGCYRDMVVADGIAYVANEWGLELIDVSSPLTPTLASYVELQPEEWIANTGVDVSGNLAYVVGEDGLYIVDVSDPVSPTVVLEGYCDDCAGPPKDYDVAVHDTKAYVTHAGGDSLKILDVSDPSHPAPVGAYEGPNLPEMVTVVDGLAYVAFGNGGLHAIDVADPTSPELAFSYDTPGYAMASAVVGDHVYLTDAHGGLLVLELGAGQSGSGALASDYHTFVERSWGDAASIPSRIGTFGDKASPMHYGSIAVGMQSAPSVQSGPDAEFAGDVQRLAGTCVVTSTADSGLGTLRECIQNAVSGDTITFDPALFPPHNPATITLQTNLPGIWQGDLTVDGSEAGVILDGSLVQDGTGLYISSDNNVIRGLQILHFSGTGVWIEPGENNTIGGDRSIGAGPMGQGNLISDNREGIAIWGSEAMSNTVIGNFIGTDASGLHALGNENIGVIIPAGASYNRVGGTSPGERNVISAHGRYGVHLIRNAGHNVVVGNYIGTDVNGTIDLGNGEDGVILELGAWHNVVEDNLISGNGLGGVHISDRFSSYNTVVGNLIGTDASGTQALGNVSYGVAVGWGGANFNRIGGTWPGEGNLISGNDVGVELHGREAGNLILGNLIGTNTNGTEAISNNSGIFMIDDSSHNFIGGATPEEGNLISGNGLAGMDLMPGERNFIIGNYIGTDASGTSALPNGQAGIDTATKSSWFQGNVIAGNQWEGVSIGPGAEFNHLRANRIGVGADGESPVPNVGAGVRIEAPSNVVGGWYPGDGNVIAFNAVDGVQAWHYPGNTIRRNSIHDNSGSGIQLLDGGNNMLPAPTIAYALPGSAWGMACPGCIVEVFSDDEDEGRVYEGNALADATGNWIWVGSPTGPYLTATATDQAGNTSAFSAPRTPWRHAVYLPLGLKGYQ